MTLIYVCFMLSHQSPRKGEDLHSEQLFAETAHSVYILDNTIAWWTLS